jgi:hypothetical protein
MEMMVMGGYGWAGKRCAGNGARADMRRPVLGYGHKLDGRAQSSVAARRKREAMK